MKKIKVLKKQKNKDSNRWLERHLNDEYVIKSKIDGYRSRSSYKLIQINQKFNKLKDELGNLGENKLLLITAVKVMDEYYETKKKIEQKKIEYIENRCTKMEYQKHFLKVRQAFPVLQD